MRYINVVEAKLKKFQAILKIRTIHKVSFQNVNARRVRIKKLLYTLAGVLLKSCSNYRHSSL